MKTFVWSLFFIGFSLAIQAQSGNLYDYTVKTIDGEVFPLAQLKGKKVLVVNVASRCGLTPQYEQLQALYDKYKENNFMIIGFPANNFREQEPGSAAEIKEFCQLNYGVTFPLMEKISVVGEDMAPVYQWLTRKELNGKQDAEVTWNFQKFMIDENGNWVGTAEPRSVPDSEEMIRWIEGDK